MNIVVIKFLKVAMVVNYCDYRFTRKENIIYTLQTSVSLA